jgi:hypothetical protein
VGKGVVRAVPTDIQKSEAQKAKTSRWARLRFAHPTDASAASGHLAARTPIRTHPLAVMVLPRLPMVMARLGIRHPDIIGGSTRRRSERKRQDRKPERDRTENPLHAFLPCFSVPDTTMGFLPKKLTSPS